MVKISDKFKIASLAELGILTQEVNKIVNGDLRLVADVGGGEGSSWYRYHLPSTLPLFGNVVSAIQGN